MRRTSKYDDGSDGRTRLRLLPCQVAQHNTTVLGTDVRTVRDVTDVLDVSSTGVFVACASSRAAVVSCYRTTEGEIDGYCTWGSVLGVGIVLVELYN